MGVLLTFPAAAVIPPDTGVGSKGPPLPRSRTPLRQVIPAWIRDRRSAGYRASGVDSYERSAYRFVGHVGELLAPGDVTAGTVRSFVRQRSQAVSTATVANELAAIRALLAWCVQEGYAASDPAAAVTSPRTMEPNPAPLSSADLSALVVALDNRSASHLTQWRRNRCAVYVMLYSGLRIAEAAGLEWRDLDLERRQLTVRREVAKGGRPRVVPIADELVTELRAMPARRVRPGAAVLGKPTGEPVTPKSLAHVFERWLPARGVHIHAHQLRATFATELHTRGVDLVTIQRLLGHKDPKTTMHYVKACTSKDVDNVNKLTFQAERRGK